MIISKQSSFELRGDFALPEHVPMSISKREDLDLASIFFIAISSNNHSLTISSKINSIPKVIITRIPSQRFI